MTCVFCPDNWPNLDIVERYGQHIVINPLDPVTPGHVLVISSFHTTDIGEKPDFSGSLMATAALHAGLTFREFNIITSAGPSATQTVMHTHVHIVPRRENDGLPLPWTPQHELKAVRAVGEGEMSLGMYQVQLAEVIRRWPHLREEVAQELQELMR